jgi:hypothetical protein
MHKEAGSELQAQQPRNLKVPILVMLLSMAVVQTSVNTNIRVSEYEEEQVHDVLTASLTLAGHG